MSTEKRENTVLAAGVGVLVLIFTIMGFFVKQDCDIDRIYLWCRLHPFSFGDFLGCTLFYAGAALLSGVWRRWFELWHNEHDVKWNLVSAGAMVLGIVLIWNL